MPSRPKETLQLAKIAQQTYRGLRIDIWAPLKVNMHRPGWPCDTQEAAFLHNIHNVDIFENVHIAVVCGRSRPWKC